MQKVYSHSSTLKGTGDSMKKNKKIKTSNNATYSNNEIVIEGKNCNFTVKQNTKTKKGWLV